MNTKKKIILKRYLLIINILLITVAVIAINQFNEKKSKEYVIELREGGFYPRVLYVSPGTTVRFMSSLAASFWPASDPHPTHSNNPEFDSQKPIDSKRTWSFTFMEPDTWYYHDHMRPYFNGKIVVSTEKNGLYKFYTGSNISLRQQDRWLKEIQIILTKSGVERALKKIADLYDTEPQFSDACHVFLHRVGGEAYKQFSQGKDFSITPEVTYCNYGFFHGFMEEMITTTRSMRDAVDFCAYVDKQLSFISSEADVQCFHGIGHGVLEESVANSIGNPQKMIATPIQICEKASQKREQLLNCISGVFNGISNFYVNNQYGLIINKNDPLELCHEQSQYRPQCYGNLHRVAREIVRNYDFLSAVAFIYNMYKDNMEAVLPVVWYLANIQTIPLVGTNSFGTIISNCDKLEKRLQPSCIKGVLSTIFEYGKPENEYREVLNICQFGELSNENRETCFTYATFRMNRIYSSQKLKTICETEISPLYQKFCK